MEAEPPYPRRIIRSVHQKKSTKNTSARRSHHAGLGIVVSKIIAQQRYVENDDAFFHRRFYSLLRPRPQENLPISVVNFPTILVNCLNSGDNVGLSDLLRGSLCEDCAVGIYCFNSRVSTKTFLRYFELTSLVQPDRILHINDTSVMQNRVTASSMIKFTACKLLFDFVAKTVSDPDLTSLFNNRAEHLRRRLCNADRSEEERRQMMHLIESDVDLVMYGAARIQVTFDEVTNKVTGLYLAGGLTSAHPMPLET